MWMLMINESLNVLGHIYPPHEVQEVVNNYFVILECFLHRGGDLVRSVAYILRGHAPLSPKNILELAELIFKQEVTLTHCDVS